MSSQRGDCGRERRDQADPCGGNTPFQRLHEVQKQMYEALSPLLFGKRVERTSSMAQVETSGA